MQYICLLPTISSRDVLVSWRHSAYVKNSKAVPNHHNHYPDHPGRPVQCAAISVIYTVY